MLQLFLIIHVIICILLYLLMRIHLLKCSRMIMPVVLLVPVWGMGCFLVLEIHSRGSMRAREEVGIEKLLISDEVHRSILMDEDTTEDRVVPLEEALLINDPAMRRELMLNIMYDDPQKYGERLLAARTNDDTEVVHYAVTALAQMQTQYDLEFQNLERELTKVEVDKTPEEAVQDKENWLKLAERYLQSGLAEGNVRMIRLRRYMELLREKTQREPDEMETWCSLVQTEMEMKEYEAALEDMEQVVERWPGNERGYLLLLDYYAELYDRRGIDRVLTLLRDRRVHLSAVGRNRVEFWEKGGRYAQGQI
ncbi:MAG: hypothetical protein LUC90_02835 [Lachnospiraceae bacterium]|nr:hypothetical protein [Lachnospiraceae bacterium]